MNYPQSWRRFTVTKKISARYLEKYGHLLNWQLYKEDILDVGCGEGSLTKTILFPYVKEHIQKLLGIDVVEDMITLAKEDHQTEKIRFQTTDILDRKHIKKMKGKFDHVFSFCVAHWITDNRSFFATLFEVLKPGGQIFVISLGDNFITRSFTRQAKEEKWANYVKLPIFADYTDKPSRYLRTMLEDIGFSTDICESEYINCPMEHFKEFTINLIQMLQKTKKIPLVLPEGFVEDHVRYCCQEFTYLGEPDKYETPLQVIICIATKAI